MGRIVIDKEICKGCYLCAKACPKGLLQKSDTPNKHGDFPIEFVDPGKQCIGCAACARNCPDVAIKEVYR